MKKEEHIFIIGAGLSGLTLAYLLSKKHIKTTILEASPRVGGRIQTVNGSLDTPLELGATWFSNMHVNVIDLLDELGIEKFKQFTQGISLFQTSESNPIQQFKVPENQNVSYRVAGGTEALISALHSKIPEDSIKLNTKVTKIKELDNKLSIHTSTGEELYANKVIMCLPPQLVGSNIEFTPSLPDVILTILPTVQTWMAGSIKFVLEYETPFWRDKAYSGMVFSHVGIVSEMHDHTNFEENKFGFTGFLNSSASSYSQEDRKKYVIQYLEYMFGESGLEPVSYFDKIWTNEFILGDNPIIQRPHQNNGHPIFDKGYLNEKLFFSGTESSIQFAGYMEGAIVAAKTAFRKIISNY